ncbi:unnamed protein product [Trichobilharzia szidati]|nr:unnamed protein product [Trichobilharzia szidati]
MVFGHFVHELKSLAGGKVVIVLEGGYFVDSLAEGTVHVLKALLGDPLSPLQLIRPPCSSVKRTIKSCIVALRDHWKSIGTADISKIIPRPSLQHLPNISWSLMKTIAWPETNPQLPRVLTNHIQQLLTKHFPAPLSILNKHSQRGDPQLTLILMPTSPSLLSPSSSLSTPTASSSASLSRSSSLTTLSSTSSSSSSTTSSLPVRRKSAGGKRLPHQQQQKQQHNQENRSSIPESLLKKLHGKVHIHFYNDPDTSAVDYICPGDEFNPTKKSRLIEPASSSSQHLSSRKGVKQLNNAGDDKCVGSVKSRQELKRIHEKSTKRVKSISIELKCNCTFYPITSKGQIGKDTTESIKMTIKEPFLNLQTAFTQALISVFMGEFHRLYISVKSLSLLQFINAITDIPIHFLSNYRERIFRPRYFQMNSNKTNTSNSNNSNSKNGINNNNNGDRTAAYVNSFKQLKNESLFNIPIVKDESLKQLANVYSPASSSSSPSSLDSLPLSTASMSRSPKALSTPSKFKGKSRFTDRHTLEKIIGYNLIKSEDFFIKPCRILVLDLAGTKEFNEKKIKEINTSLSGVSSKNIQCDLIWCSVYHGELADRLIRKPDELRAKELCNSNINCTSKAASVSNTNRINNLIWLKIPIPRTTASTTTEKTQATQSSNKKRTSSSLSLPPSTQAQTPSYATNTINLLSIIYHIFLPISYEFGPDLVYLLIGSNEDDYNFITPDASARLLYLLNGLGAAVIVSGTAQQLCSDSLVRSLLGKPLPTGFDETQSTSPSPGQKQEMKLINYETVLSSMQKTQLNCLEQDSNYNNNNKNNMTNDSQLGDIVCTKSSPTVNATTPISSPMNSTPMLNTTTTKIPGMLNDDASSTVSKLHSTSRPIMGLNRSVQMKSIGNNNNHGNLLYPITSMNQMPTTTTTGSIQQLQHNQQNNNLLNQITLNETINKDYNTTNLLPKTNSSDQINPDTGIGGSTPMTTQSTSTATATTGVTETINTSGQINSNVYDLPEPEWITQTLKQYYEYNILHSNKQNIPSGFTIGSCSSATTTTTSGGGTGAGGGGVPLDFEQSLFDHISAEEMILLESNDHETVDDEMAKNYLPSQFSPNALLILLASLANSSPYPRLSEAFQCAQLIWRRLLTKLARYRADCLVLQANLAEIKSNADHMQCQLNQIEANWSVIVRAVQMSEAALEISDCLNQLYSTELAVTICRQTQKHLLPKHPFSTISSSTSSSSFHGYSSEEHDLSNHGQPILPNNFNLNTLKLFRQQAEFLAYTVLDKYETSDGGYEKILPTTCMPNMMMMNAPTMATTPSVAGATAAAGGGLSNPRGTIANHQSQQQQQQHPSQSPVSPGVFSIQSAITSSNSLLDNNSVYANSWYVSLNRSRANGDHQFRQHQHKQQQQQQTNVNGSFPSMNHQLQQHAIRMNSMSNNPQMRTFLKSSYSPHISANQTMSSTGGNTGNGGGGGGWETPDSGAGSSSMNEVSSQQQQQLLLSQQSQHHHQQPFLNPPFLLSSSSSSLLFGHFYQTYGVNNNSNNNNNNSNGSSGSNSNNKLNSQSDLFLFNSLLDNLPPLWTFLTKSSASFYESDLDSSDSSDALGNTTHTTHHHHNISSSQPSHCLQHQQQHNQTSNTNTNPPNLSTTPNNNNTSSYIHLSNWSRIEERKLRTIYCQLINTYKRLKSMLIDLPNLDMSMNHHEGVLETSSSFISSYPDADSNNPMNKLLSPMTIQQQTDSDRMSRLNQWNSASMNSLRKLPLAVFLENSVLLQELCCVKEECADLKVRVYLLEKELCANRLTLESRAAAERALRAHLDALITEQHNRYSQTLLTNDKQKDNSTTTTTAAVGINQHEIVLLRGQVKVRRSLIWCSVYHGELADQLIRKPDELRAKELCNSNINCTSKAASVSNTNRINNLIWLKIPIPRTTASTTTEKTQATQSSNKKRTSSLPSSSSSPPLTQSQTPSYATNTINLLSIIYHIFLPISYEFGPDLVYLLIGSNEDDYNFITPDTSARLLYLLNGLGAAVIVSGTAQQLCSDSLVRSLLGKPLPTGFNETQSTSPSPGVKQAIHLVMEQNHQRWKFLKFCGSLPKWT